MTMEQVEKTAMGLRSTCAGKMKADLGEIVYLIKSVENRKKMRKKRGIDDALK